MIESPEEKLAQEALRFEDAKANMKSCQRPVEPPHPKAKDTGTYGANDDFGACLKE